jgi:hypothetical protein
METESTTTIHQTVSVWRITVRPFLYPISGDAYLTLYADTIDVMVERMPFFLLCFDPYLMPISRGWWMGRASSAGGGQ